MSRPLKKSIKNNGMMKVNKKVINFKNKSGGVLLRVFCVNVSVFLCFFFFFFFELLWVAGSEKLANKASLLKCKNRGDIYAL